MIIEITHKCGDVEKHSIPNDGYDKGVWNTPQKVIVARLKTLPCSACKVTVPNQPRDYALDDFL